MNDTYIAINAFAILSSIGLAMGAQIYIAHKYTEYFESLLPNCIFMKDNKRTFEHAGLIGKLLRTGLISLVLAAPRIFVHRGVIDPDEIKRFPARTKRLLVGLLIIHLLLASALIISHHALPKP